VTVTERSVCRAYRRISDSINDIDLGFDQLRRKFRNQINVQCMLPPNDCEILALNEAKSPKFIEHRDTSWRIEWTAGQTPNAIGPPRLLRLRSERPCDARAYKRDELAPPHRFPVPRRYSAL
jgi:hypothetical protein